MNKQRVQTTMNQPPRQRSGAALTAAQTTGACDQLLAELQARRIRLRQLLQLVQLEAIRLSAAPVRGGQRPQCINPRLKRSA